MSMKQIDTDNPNEAEQKVMELSQKISSMFEGERLDVAFGVIMTLLEHVIAGAPEDIRAEMVLAIMHSSERMIDRHDLASSIIMPGGIDASH